MTALGGSKRHFGKWDLDFGIDLSVALEVQHFAFFSYGSHGTFAAFCFILFLAFSAFHLWCLYKAALEGNNIYYYHLHILF
jgi:hypothetical protein